MSDSPAFFADERVRSAAADAGVDADDLRALLSRHQEGMSDLPGVDGLVYEWRTTLREDPLAFADGEAYYVALPRRIWRQFADHHDMSDAEFEAVLSVHEATARAAAPDDGGDGPASLDDGHPMALLKA
ncbi:hypothetical protein [Halostella litorea]|uniref:hypothetical protein n=1 Tax=Halostella litorea TaxID=2528831 RepID=UPI0010926A02|nr:hypothetical protein [Halostella litorea]